MSLYTLRLRRELISLEDVMRGAGIVSRACGEQDQIYDRIQELRAALAEEEPEEDYENVTCYCGAVIPAEWGWCSQTCYNLDSNSP